MKITEINVYDVPLPVVGKPYKMSRSELVDISSTVVEVITDTGLRGFGETCPVGPTYAPQHTLGARSALQEFCPSLVGENPLTIDKLYRAMDARLNGLRYAKAAIDIAAWDIAGKSYRARVCDLLGGGLRDRVPSYYSIVISSPDESARIAKERQKEGYPRLQLKVGGRTFEEDLAAIRKVGEVLQPGTKLAVDANRGWLAREAISASRLNEDLNFVMEQPCDTYEEMLAIRGKLRHPLYLDESTVDMGVVLRAIGDGLADGFGFKVTRLGGLSTMRTVRDICAARNLPHTCDDSWGGDIIAAACVHLAATMDERLCDGSWIAEPYLKGHYDEANPVRVTDGWIAVPKGAGLGVEPDVRRWGKPILTFG